MSEDEIARIMSAIGELKGILSGVNTAMTDIKTNINELYEDRNTLRSDLDKLTQAHDDQMKQGGCNNNVNIDTTPPLKESLMKAILKPSIPIIITGAIVLAILITLKSMGLTL